MAGCFTSCVHVVQGLVLDDNRCNAAMALAYSNTACTYRFQAPDRFYQCRLVQLQWSRTANSLRCVCVLSVNTPSNRLCLWLSVV